MVRLHRQRALRGHGRPEVFKRVRGLWALHGTAGGTQNGLRGGQCITVWYLGAVVCSFSDLHEQATTKLSKQCPKIKAELSHVAP